MSTTGSNPIVVAVPVAAPFDFDLTVSAHGRFSQEAVNRYWPGRFCRAFWLNGRPVVAELRPEASPEDAPQTAILTLTGEGISLTEAQHLVERVSFMFGLQERPGGFSRAHRGRQSAVETGRSVTGVCIPFAGPSLYELLVGAIISQQITLSFAATVRQRFVHQYGHAASYENLTLWTFPSPEMLVNATVEELMALQFSRRKAEYLIDLSRAMAFGVIDESELRLQPDADVIERLMSQRGLGLWSAQWALIRALGPAGRCAGGRHWGAACGRHLLSAHRWGLTQGIRGTGQLQIAEGWRPFRSPATHYLLTALRLLDQQAQVSRNPTQQDRTPAS